MTINLLEKLHYQQYDFFFSEEPFSALITGRGFGKTFVSALKIIIKACQGYKGLVVAPTYSMLVDVLWSKVIELLNKYKIPYKPNKAEMTLTIITTLVYFRSAQQPDRMRGLEYGWFCIDEAGQIKNDDIWKIALGGCRQKEPEAWITTTPNGLNWIYDKFGRDDRQKGYALFQGETKQNRNLPSRYISELYNEYTGNFLEQEAKGRFVSMEGQLFKKEKLLFYNESLLQQEDWFKDTTIYGYLDPATGSAKGDYSSFVTGIKKNDLFYVLDIVLDKFDDTQMIEVFRESIGKWNHHQIGIESLFWQKKYVFDKIQNEFVSFPFIEMRDTTNKQTRIAGIQPLIETKIFFPERWIHEKNSYGRKALDQMFAFNIADSAAGKINDDFPDSLEGLLRMFRKLNGINTVYVGSTNDNDYFKDDIDAEV